ncbi:MAG TPA: hypothetical protein VK890_03805 [Bacteroidia bacterium]|jgi:hypothetical protein|nr:hypothetical protein [Bacteroidia bacterium]
MRKSLVFLTISALVIYMSACNTKLNVQAPYKHITVVYGLMDQNDTAHYIRVNKAYEGAGDAYTMGKVFDSIYYPANQISVTLQDYNSSGVFMGNITLTPDSSIPVPPGIFSYPKQILYKTKAALNVNDTYNLIVFNEKTQQTLTGSTTLLQDASFLPGTLGSTNLPMSFFEASPSKILWSSSLNGRIYQMVFRFYYNETGTANPGEKYIDWIFTPQTASTILGGATMEYDYTGEGFLQQVRTNIQPIAGAHRRSDSIQVIFTTGSDDFNTYIQISQPSLGIDQDPPSYSDVKNGIGIYTSRHTQIITKQLTIATHDSLINGSGMAPWGFN